jgi:hypothetical protein
VSVLVDAEDLVDSLLRQPYLRLRRGDDEVGSHLDLIEYVRVVKAHVEHVVHGEKLLGAGGVALFPRRIDPDRSYPKYEDHSTITMTRVGHSAT